MIADEFGFSPHAAAKYDIETQYHATPKTRRIPLPTRQLLTLRLNLNTKGVYTAAYIISCDSVIVKSFFGLFLSNVVGILRMP